METNNLEDKIEAVVIPQKMIYENSDDDYRIYSCKVDSSATPIKTHPIYKNISMSGSMTKLAIGEKYNVKLQDKGDEKYPASYYLQGLTFDFPKDTKSQRKYLEAVVNKNKVSAIYDFYNKGEDVIKLIQDNEFDHKSVKGFGLSSYEKLKEDIMSHSDSKELTALLSPFDVTLKSINAIFKSYHYNDQLAVQEIKKNPYALVKVDNIGFKKADFIALKMGHSRTGADRINNAILYVLQEATKEGDTWIQDSNLVVKASGLMGINKKYTEDELLTKRYEDYHIKNIGGRFALSFNYDYEKIIAESIFQSSTNAVRYFDDEEITEFLFEYQLENNIELEEKQLEFFYNWNNNTINFLVGGAGMGKTALMNILVKLLKTKGIQSALMAPTGKSSKILAEYTNQEASTIHRALAMGGSLGLHEEGMNFDNYRREAIDKGLIEARAEDDIEFHEEGGNGDAPITVRHIIVDEVSMMDVHLASRLLKQVYLDSTKILFVGDDYQLPSVGVGNFLYDCIGSDVASVTRLRKVFRQEEGGILDIATKVRQGKPFLTRDMEGPHEFGKDCVIDLTNQSSVPFATDYYYEQFLNEGLSPDDIMILSPTRVGGSGTVALNNRAQLVINPVEKPESQGLRVEYDKGEPTIFHVGDLIINTVNSYDRDKYSYGRDGITETTATATIFNGDTGRILKISGNDVYAEFDDILFKFTAVEMKKMMLHSYCITIHRFQGSASKAVILVLDKSATFQLNANLIYTGITRAKEKLIIIGQADTIINSGRKFVNMKRKSFLGDMLAGKI